MTYSVHGRPAGRDPFLDYGVKASRLVLSRVAALPPAQRKRGLRMVLDRIDPALWTEVEKKGAAYAAAGHPPKEALERALAAGLANGLTADLVRLGKGRRPRAALSGCGALGATPIRVHKTFHGITFSYTANPDDKPDLSGTMSKVYAAPLRTTLPPDAVKALDDLAKSSHGGDTIPTDKSGYPNQTLWRHWDPPYSDGTYGVTIAFSTKPITYAAWDQAPAAVFVLYKDGGSSIIAKIGEAFSRLPDAFVGGFQDLTKLPGAVVGLACAAVNNPVGQIAAGAGAAYAGASPGTAAAGVGIAQGICNGPSQLPPIQEASSFPWVPVLVLGAGGILVAWGLS